jgi:hypothetical protein
MISIGSFHNYLIIPSPLAISNDEDVRFDLLEWVSAGHCSAIFEQQMSANPVGYTIASLTTAAPICQILDHCEEEIASTSKETNLPLWRFLH